MARNVRIAAIGTLAVTALVVAILGGAYYAVRQVRPFYQQALQLEPEVLERGGRELEVRATALYSDAKQRGQWEALFTTEQINGWLATQLSANEGGQLPANIRDPRVAIVRNLLTLGFRTSSGGVETVVSVDAAVFLTAEGAVGICLKSVRAGALPLPVMQLADQLAAACKELKLPVRWIHQNGQPVALIEIHSDPSAQSRQFFIDSIELGEGELYVAGHTDVAGAPARNVKNSRSRSVRNSVALDGYELRLTPNHEQSALEIALRSTQEGDDETPSR
jgi:hypothetical protein